MLCPPYVMSRDLDKQARVLLRIFRALRSPKYVHAHTCCESYRELVPRRIRAPSQHYPWPSFQIIQAAPEQDRDAHATLLTLTAPPRRTPAGYSKPSIIRLCRNTPTLANTRSRQVHYLDSFWDPWTLYRMTKLLATREREILIQVPHF